MYDTFSIVFLEPKNNILSKRLVSNLRAYHLSFDVFGSASHHKIPPSSINAHFSVRLDFRLAAPVYSCFSCKLSNTPRFVEGWHIITHIVFQQLCLGRCPGRKSLCRRCCHLPKRYPLSSWTSNYDEPKKKIETTTTQNPKTRTVMLPSLEKGIFKRQFLNSFDWFMFNLSIDVSELLRDIIQQAGAR